MLTQIHLHDTDFTTAASELLANARQLLIAGHFDAARRVAGLLAKGPGQWLLHERP